RLRGRRLLHQRRRPMTAKQHHFWIVQWDVDEVGPFKTRNAAKAYVTEFGIGHVREFSGREVPVPEGLKEAAEQWQHLEDVHGRKAVICPLSVEVEPKRRLFVEA